MDVENVDEKSQYSDRISFSHKTFSALKQTLDSADNMLRYAKESGLLVNETDAADLGELIAKVESLSINSSDKEQAGVVSGKTITLFELKGWIRSATEIHNNLAVLIKPAVPRGTQYSLGLSRGRFDFMADAPSIVIHTLVVTLFFLLGLIVISSVDAISTTAFEGNFWDRSFDSNLWIASLFLCAAGLGTSLYNLHKMYGYIVGRSYDPAYQSSYWVRLIIGLVSGYFLAEIVTVNVLSDSGFDKPLLAFIGGFSADVVEHILQRFVETLKALIQGNDKSREKIAEQKNEQALKSEMAKAKIDAVKSLGQLRSGIANNGASKEVLDQIDRLIEESLP